MATKRSGKKKQKKILRIGGGWKREMLNKEKLILKNSDGKEIVNSSIHAFFKPKVPTPPPSPKFYKVFDHQLVEIAMKKWVPPPQVWPVFQPYIEKKLSKPMKDKSYLDRPMPEPSPDKKGKRKGKKGGKTKGGKVIEGPPVGATNPDGSPVVFLTPIKGDADSMEMSMSVSPSPEPNMDEAVKVFGILENLWKTKGQYAVTIKILLEASKAAEVGGDEKSTEKILKKLHEENVIVMTGEKIYRM